ncbi:D-alanyl-D-alanine carboxypeptidase/D-alanyl-D-alanine-endopeptidase [Nocardioides dubius]|uniref:D-alanyl-D-alanine carboxypeptidase/D-alanyl-D-alanine endopeptidase n=1 Tax=Nocardioides dubius TaxID=317019 RepID=UPI0039EC189C
MGKGDARHSSRLLLWAPIGLVLCLLGAGFAAFEYDLGERWGIAETAPSSPAEVPAPQQLQLPASAPAGPVAEPAAASGTADERAIRRAVAKILKRKTWGDHVVAAVGSPGGEVWFDNAAGVGTPASLTKLVTGLAALDALGAEHTFTTKVVATTGEAVILVGGGDPYLAAEPAKASAWPKQADLRTLAAETAAALAAEGRTSIRLQYDDSLFSGPTLNPRWPADYFSDGVVAPITALWADQGDKRDGWGHEADPSRSAAQLFAGYLRKAGVQVTGKVRPASAPSTASVLAEAESAPLSQVVEQVIAVSDNEGAELLAHHVGLAEGTGGSFTGGARGVRAVLSRLGVPMAGARLFDGSGLSRDNLLSARTLLGVLSVAAQQPALRAVIEGLPVAGFNGSAALRLAESDPEGLGRVRAKTGTLTGVHGFAGVIDAVDGTVFTFVVFADRVKVEDTLAVRESIDDFSAALAACRCG